MSLDRAIPEDQVGLYGDLAQFPIAGQALVLAYSISTLNSTDPLLVQPHLPQLQFASKLVPPTDGPSFFSDTRQEHHWAHLVRDR